MIKIPFFIIPVSLVTKVVKKAAEFVPILGPAVDFTNKVQKVTDVSNRVNASSKAIGILFVNCFGKAGTISVEYSLWLTLSVAGGITANPEMISAGAISQPSGHLINLIF